MPRRARLGAASLVLIQQATMAMAMATCGQRMKRQPKVPLFGLWSHGLKLSGLGWDRVAKGRVAASRPLVTTCKRIFVDFRVLPTCCHMCSHPVPPPPPTSCARIPYSFLFSAILFSFGQPFGASVVCSFPFPLPLPLPVSYLPRILWPIVALHRVLSGIYCFGVSCCIRMAVATFYRHSRPALTPLPRLNQSRVLSIFNSLFDQGKKLSSREC